MPGQRTVLVTGANSGIGLATVVEVARAGFDAVGSVRSAERARVVRHAAAEAGVQVRTAILDVRDADACGRAVRRLRPYGLVNNAGYSVSGAIEDVADEEARAAFETMVLAPMRLARLALPAMRRAGEGRIVNLSSIYGLTTTPLTGWYQACKHALEAVSDALRVETAASGVRVVLIEPGGFDTGIWDRARSEIRGRRASSFRGAYSRAETSIRLTRPLMGDPARVARTVVTALRSSRPRTRYLVGVDARAIAVYGAVVPEWLRDRLARAALGL